MLYKKLPESKQKLVLSSRKKQNIIIMVIKTIQNRNCGINHHHRTRDYTCCIFTVFIFTYHRNHHGNSTLKYQDRSVVLYTNCKENVKQKILLTSFFQVNGKILTLFQHQMPQSIQLMAAKALFGNH